MTFIHVCVLLMTLFYFYFLQALTMQCSYLKVNKPKREGVQIGTQMFGLVFLHNAIVRTC